MQNALGPRDYDMVQSIFKLLVRSDWFDRTDANEQECAKLVLSEFGDGGIGEAELLARCREIALERFGRRH